MRDLKQEASLFLSNSVFEQLKFCAMLSMKKVYKPWGPEHSSQCKKCTKYEHGFILLRDIFCKFMTRVEFANVNYTHSVY